MIYDNSWSSGINNFVFFFKTDGSRSAFRSLGSDKNSSVGIKPVLPEMSPQIGRRTDQNSQVKGFCN